MKKTFLTVLTLIITLLAQAQHPLGIEEMLHLKRVGAPAVSADGNAICYVVETVSIENNKGSKDLFLQSIGKQKSEPIQLTNTPDINENSPCFNNKGSHIYFISAESGSPQVWVMDINTKSISQVTNFENGVGSFLISKDENYLYFTADVRMEKSVNEIYPDAPKSEARIIDDLMYRHWDSWDDYNYTHLFFTKLNNRVADANATDLMEGEPYDVGGFDVSPDGKSVAYSCKKLKGKEFALSTNTDIYYYQTESKQVKNLSQSNLGYDLNPKFSNSGKYLVWGSMKTAGFESDKTNILMYDFASSKLNYLAPDFPEGASNLTWSNDDKEIYFIATTKATYQIYSLNIASGKVNQITQGDHDCKSIGLGNKSIIYTKTTMMLPVEIYSWDLIKSGETQLSFVNKAALANIIPSKVEKRMVKTTDGKEMLVWHILPPNFDPSKKYPTLLYCQGGPQSPVSCFYSFRWNFQLMAAQGYIIVAPNRRGLPGFGQEWNDQISGDWGGQAMKDYLSAIDDASNLPYVDKTRLGAVGASYGGYSVYWLAGNHNKRFKTFIAHCGLFNLESWYTSTEEMFFANHDIGGPYWNSTYNNAYNQFSPHRFVKNWDTPIMVIHGEKDFRVPIGEGMQAFGVAQLKNIKSRFLYFPDEGHWVVKPQNSLVWHREFYRWLKETL